MKTKPCQETSYVYGLRVIGRKRFFYVGTSISPKTRLYAHKKVFAFKGKIEMKVLRKCGGCYQRMIWEKYWIIKLIKEGHRLCNKGYRKPSPIDLYI